MANFQAMFIKNITVLYNLYFYIKAIEIFHPFVISQRGNTILDLYWNSSPF